MRGVSLSVASVMRMRRSPPIMEIAPASSDRRAGSSARSLADRVTALKGSLRSETMLRPMVLARSFMRPLSGP